MINGEKFQTQLRGTFVVNLFPFRQKNGSAGFVFLEHLRKLN